MLWKRCTEIHYEVLPELSHCRVSCRYLKKNRQYISAGMMMSFFFQFCPFTGEAIPGLKAGVFSEEFSYQD